MGWLRRLHAAFWGMATVAMLILWVRSYWSDYDHFDYCRLIDLQGYGRISFQSMMGRVITGIEFGWNGSWPQWVEFGTWPYQETAGFGSDNVCECLHITAPHWFFVLFAASATWYLVNPSYRFSLRTLMVLTGVVAVLMGSWFVLDRQFLPSDWLDY